MKNIRPSSQEQLDLCLAILNSQGYDVPMFCEFKKLNQLRLAKKPAYKTDIVKSPYEYIYQSFGHTGKKSVLDGRSFIQLYGKKYFQEKIKEVEKEKEMYFSCMQQEKDLREKISKNFSKWIIIAILVSAFFTGSMTAFHYENKILSWNESVSGSTK